VIRGLKAVAAAGLPFDLLVRAHQLPAAVEAVRAVPELTFVLDHLGNPPIGKQSPWDIRALASAPNVVAKLSGLPTEAKVGDLRPYVEEALAAFGPARLMWGSDWPVCLLAATYAQVHSTTDLLTAHLTATEREAIFAGTATRIYQLSTTH
jgi:L-fuconolactonase